MDNKYQEALCGLTSSLSRLLKQVPAQTQSRVREICLRADKPLVLATFEGECFITNNGLLKSCLTDDIRVVSKAEVDECVRILTEYSVHSFKDKINMGFITIKGGHRAGIVGSCVLSDEKIIAITDISSVNLRIARQVKGIATELVKELYTNRVCGTLIIGCPASGKTTLLRDMAYSLSNGILGSYIKLSIIDERGELAAMKDGVAQNDVGVLSDVLNGYKKGDGMTIAIRSMSPKVIVLDEIGSVEDANSVRQGMNAGVSVIATAHAGSLQELVQKKHIFSLIEERAFEKIVLLHGAQKPGSVKQIIKARDMQYELKSYDNQLQRKGFVACIE